MELSSESYAMDLPPLSPNHSTTGESRSTARFRVTDMVHLVRQKSRREGIPIQGSSWATSYNDHLLIIVLILSALGFISARHHLMKKHQDDVAFEDIDTSYNTSTNQSDLEVLYSGDKVKQTTGVLRKPVLWELYADIREEKKVLDGRQEMGDNHWDSFLLLQLPCRSTRIYHHRRNVTLMVQCRIMPLGSSKRHPVVKHRLSLKWHLRLTSLLLSLSKKRRLQQDHSCRGI
ncbi:hypothetical protein C8Q75DRAFT_422252 [Abortiporus biennis]|nr:hypothetical protein C8Q75DRAFT_422252 [Abortiporus biennis]